MVEVMSSYSPQRRSGFNQVIGKMDTVVVPVPNQRVWTSDINSLNQPKFTPGLPEGYDQDYYETFYAMYNKIIFDVENLNITHDYIKKYINSPVEKQAATKAWEALYPLESRIKFFRSVDPRTVDLYQLTPRDRKALFVSTDIANVKLNILYTEGKIIENQNNELYNIDVNNITSVYKRNAIIYAKKIRCHRQLEFCRTGSINHNVSVTSTLCNMSNTVKFLEYKNENDVTDQPTINDIDNNDNDSMELSQILSQYKSTMFPLMSQNKKYTMIDVGSPTKKRMSPPGSFRNRNRHRHHKSPQSSDDKSPNYSFKNRNRGTPNNTRWFTKTQ
jgi:hypothetical protein